MMSYRAASASPEIPTMITAIVQYRLPASISQSDCAAHFRNALRSQGPDGMFPDRPIVERYFHLLMAP